MGIVTTIPEKCKRCYTCIRECPAKAIKVEGGQATVIEERCIVCGNCVKVCAQAAKSIENSVPEVVDILAGRKQVIACLAPSFPAGFYPIPPHKIVGALKALGFYEVWEVALGAELLGTGYASLFKKALRTETCVVTSPCPAIVSYVSKYMPALHNFLAPVVSPMVATARIIRKRFRNGQEKTGDRSLNGDLGIVFIGPCIAKKNEIRDPAVAGEIDAVLTFKELLRLFDERGIEPALAPDGAIDSPACRMGRSFPISGGLLKTAGLSTDILENHILITEGKDRVLPVLWELAEGKSQARFYDVLFCEGCINGPKMGNELSVFARKQIMADYVSERSKTVTEKEYLETLEEFQGVPQGRSFTFETVKLPEPGEAQIANVLANMRKLGEDEQLNCGACGYATCRDKAVAVCQGLAEPEMCLPYIVDELEVALERVKQSHEELVSAQQKLVQTERLASMGQIAAGVAHEINNPLGTIILYSHLLLKQLIGPAVGGTSFGGAADEAVQADLQMIVREATRCKNIVRGLLDFGRQSRVSKAPTSLAELAGEVKTIMGPKAAAAGVSLSVDVPEGLPVMMIDHTQIKQMLVNLVQNGIDAVGPAAGAGEVRLQARSPEKSGLKSGDESVEIEVSDNGCGITKENIGKLFTPFFTTKESTKGTGLGLAICYGIVKMHSGNIAVDSAVGKGTTFTITLPVGGGGKS